MAGVKGKSGRKAKPKAVLELRGSRWAKDRQEVALPPESGPPPCPSWLEPRAKQTWHRLVKVLHEMRIVGSIDQSALGRYCTLFWRWRDAETRLDTLKDVTSRTYTSLARVTLDYAAMLLRLETEFGMTPSARAALGLTLAKAATHAETDDPTQDKKRFFTVG